MDKNDRVLGYSEDYQDRDCPITGRKCNNKCGFFVEYLMGVSNEIGGDITRIVGTGDGGCFNIIARELSEIKKLLKNMNQMNEEERKLLEEK